MTYELFEYDVSSSSDEELEPIVVAINELSRESEPRAIDLTLDEFRVFAGLPGMIHHRYVVRTDDGSIAAVGGGRFPDDGTNADVLATSIRVLPAHRRQGIGSMILTRLAELAEGLGRHRLQGVFFDTVPAGHEFARVVGATENMEFHENVVRIDDIDRSLMDDWSEIGVTRAPGYSIELIEGPIPQARFADVAHLFHVLERDMPMSDDFEPRNWNAEVVRQQQEQLLKGTESLVALAIHDESDVAVGMSQLLRRISDPTTWLVTVTMVDPTHRGRSLGKWVKGKVNVAALGLWEGGVYEETGNAFTNEPMLAINRAMGFEHEYTIVDCSLDLETAREYLSSRV